MAIEYPIKKSLGADVHNFPKVQYDKIKEIIDAVNEAQDDIIQLQTDVVPEFTYYHALLTQTTTNAPTATVLKNTLGQTITWSYSDVGEYIFSVPTNLFVAGTTVVEVTTIKGTTQFVLGGATNGKIFTFNSTTGAAANDILSNTSVKILVYN